MLDPPKWLQLGVLEEDPHPTAVPGAQAGAYVARTKLVPGRQTILPRIANLGQGRGRGAFIEPREGDEVLVFFPSGQLSQAVAFAGLGSTVRAPRPLSATGDGYLLLNPDGVELRSADGIPSHGLVLKPLVDDLATLLSQMQAYQIAVSTAFDVLFALIPEPNAQAAARAAFEAVDTPFAFQLQTLQAQLSAAVNAAGQLYVSQTNTST